MRMDRSKNAARNIIFGSINKLYQIIVPFLIRTAIIYFLGMKYLGLDSLFTSILQVLNLAELGVGNAMVFSMYRPVAEDDQEKICQLMNLYKKYYRIIGLVILILGIFLTPFVPKLITGDMPGDVNIYVLYLLNLGATVLSYWLFAYKNCLLQAHQRSDVGSKIVMLTATIKYVLQFIALLCFHNYYIYLCINLTMQVATNIVTAFVVNRMYPTYHAYGKLPEAEVKKINGRVRDLFTSKVGNIIVNSADSIVISTFLGLTILASYNSYYYIMSAVIGMVMVVFQSCTAGIGNSLLVETEEKNYKDLKKFTFIISWLGGFCTTCLLCLYQPFMRLWIGKNNLFGMEVVICFCIYYFIYEINQLLNMYKDAGGIWHEDRFRPLLTALVNLFLNLILVQFMGIYGVLLSTVVSMLIVGMPWLLHNLFSVLFQRSMKEYIVRLLIYGGITAIVSLITYLCCGVCAVDGIAGLIIKAIICVLVSSLLLFICYCRFPEFEEVKLMVKRLLKK